MGRVAYQEALDLQRALADSVRAGRSPGHLLLLEHDPVYTYGAHAVAENFLVDPKLLIEGGALVIEADRGGDVTFHGPGQLVAYPILAVERFSSRRWVSVLEASVRRTLNEFGIDGVTEPEYPGVWVGGKKICAIGVRISGGVSTHGLALNVTTDLSRFDAIVPCGIEGRGVTSIKSELGERISMERIARSLAASFAAEIGGVGSSFEAAPWPRSDGNDTDEPGEADRQEITNWPDRRPRAADGTLRPDYVRAAARFDKGYRSVMSVVRAGELNTVCEEAKCPNIYECWADGTATFMILGDQCTRACGFCNVSTSRPGAVDWDEPDRVARAAAALGLSHVVVTSVARDDLSDGGAAAFAATIRAVKKSLAGGSVEVLIPDFKGDKKSLETVLAERPDVLNHNVETVPRLQRLVRPSASYARSLAVLARATGSGHGIETKSGIMLGLGEDESEVSSVISDLAAVGVSILTIGQYLQPTAAHLPVQRWWRPDEFDELADFARRAGIRAVESSPLVRSSYRAHTSHQRLERMNHPVELQIQAR
ncbi:MAG: lipoyl synthase [Acidobacteria bacterium]|nr:MAG: lipoyl synthase [Acidobacteriota bacterium]